MKVDEWLSRWLPRRCLLCGLGSARALICRACRRDLPWIVRPCGHCGRPAVTDGGCGRCDLILGGIDRAVAALVYEYPVDQLVAAAKFQRRPESARALGEALAWWLLRAPGLTPLPDCIVPVPLHPQRQRQRGFNQAEVIARPLAAALGVKLDTRCCRRIRATQEQSALTGAQRRANLQGAFVAGRELDGQVVAIVDDVVTTGSTASALAASVQQAGAVSVQLWTATRVVRTQAVRNT